MSQVYDESNNLVPVTIIEAGPCPVLQIKSEENDGYSAIQIGFNPNGRSPKKANRCLKGHASKAGADSQKIAQEVRCESNHDYVQGNVITVENFKDIKLVDVISKYVKIQPDDIKVNLDRHDSLEVLEVKIEMPQIDNRRT